MTSRRWAGFTVVTIETHVIYMHIFHLISFKFCEYVHYMLIYNMHRENEFPMEIKKLQHFSPYLLNDPRISLQKYPLPQEFY